MEVGWLPNTARCVLSLSLFLFLSVCGKAHSSEDSNDGFPPRKDQVSQCVQRQRRDRPLRFDGL